MFFRLKIRPAFLFLAFLTFLKLWLVSSQNLVAQGEAIHDSRLFINQATSIVKGEWLGNYSNLTLIKGPMYPAWIALSFLFRVPLLLSQHLLYITACILITIALNPIISNKRFLYFFYLVLLFNPVTFDIQTFAVVLRSGIYSSLTLLSAGLLIGLYTRRNSRLTSLCIWTIGFAIVSSIFYLTREEGIWLIPFFLLIFAYLLVELVRHRPKDWILRLEILSLVPTIFIDVLIIFSLINWTKYGVFTINELKHRSFLSAYGALSRVEVGRWDQYIPVSKETREEIYLVSPSFAKLKPFLEGDIGRAWAFNSQEVTKRPDSDLEIAGGWWVFALRDAVAASGFHENGYLAMKYYDRLSQEVNAACDKGLLKCAKKRSTLIPRWRGEYYRPLFINFKEIFLAIISFKDVSTYQIPSEGLPKSLNLYKSITREELSPSVYEKTMDQNKIGQLDKFKSNVLFVIIRTYQILVPKIFVISLLIYIYSILHSILTRKFNFLTLLNTAVLASCLLFILILSVVSVAWFPAISIFYISPATTPFLIFICLNTYLLLGQVKRMGLIKKQILKSLRRSFSLR
jgi:hypothetical protein